VKSRRPVSSEVGHTVMYSKRISAFALIIMLVVFAGACLKLPCANQILKEVSSPAGKMKAVVFERDCGAPTDFSTQVSILRSDQLLPNEGGNVFVADTDHDIAPSGADGGPVVEVSWTSESELLVRHDKRARVFHFEPSVGSIRVQYETFAQ
jgi:hypothetical protein